MSRFLVFVFTDGPGGTGSDECPSVWAWRPSFCISARMSLRWRCVPGPEGSVRMGPLWWVPWQGRVSLTCWVFSFPWVSVVAGHALAPCEAPSLTPPSTHQFWHSSTFLACVSYWHQVCQKVNVCSHHLSFRLSLIPLCLHRKPGSRPCDVASPHWALLWPAWAAVLWDALLDRPSCPRHFTPGRKDSWKGGREKERGQRKRGLGRRLAAGTWDEPSGCPRCCHWLGFRLQAPGLLACLHVFTLQTHH